MARLPDLEGTLKLILSRAEEQRDSLRSIDEKLVDFHVRIDRLEQIEKRRQWQVRIIWGFLVVFFLGVMLQPIERAAERYFAVPPHNHTFGNQHPSE